MHVTAAVAPARNMLATRGPARYCGLHLFGVGAQTPPPLRHSLSATSAYTNTIVVEHYYKSTVAESVIRFWIFIGDSRLARLS